MSRIGSSFTVRDIPTLQYAGQTGRVCDLDFAHSYFDVRLRFGPSDVCAFRWVDLIDNEAMDAVGSDDDNKRYQ